MTKLDQLAPLRRPNFRRQWIAHSLSVFGDNVAPIALAFGVLAVYKSATTLGIVLAARTVTLIVLVPIGGLFADRLCRSRVMVSCDAVRFLAQGASGLMLLEARPSLALLALLQGLVGAGTGLFEPAAFGLTQETADPTQLQESNALLSLSISGSGILGPLFAGLVISLGSPGIALLADALTYLASMLLLLKIKSSAARHVSGENLLRGLALGWHEIRIRSWVWISLVNFMVFQLVALPAFFVMGPVIAKASLSGAVGWSIISVAVGIGSLVGDVAALSSHVSRPLRRGFGALTLSAPVLILLGAAPNLLALLVPAALFGLAMTHANTMWFTSLHEHIPANAISRVSSYDWLISTALRPLGFSAVGFVVVAFGRTLTMVSAGIIVLAAQCVVLAVPSVRRLGRVLPESARMGAGYPATDGRN